MTPATPLEEAVARMNSGDVEAMLELVHPDVVWEPPPGMGADVFRGHDGVRRFVAEWLEAFAEFEQTVLDADVQGDWIVARVALRTRGESSGVEVGAQSGYLMRLEDGKLIHMRIFTSYEDAVAARAELANPRRADAP